MKKEIRLAIFALVAVFAISMAYAQAPLKKPTLEPDHQEQVKKEKARKREKASKAEEARKHEELRKQEAMRNRIYDYVDLELPSGLKWATCNVGATSPEDYGFYYAWGETLPKSYYSQNNSATYGKDNDWLLSNGYIDSSGNLTPVHDAARQNWGGSWRMPTKDEIQELLENTTSIWTERNGVKGRLLTSKRNGNSIFLPAAGYRYASSRMSAESNGEYWGATFHEQYSKSCAYSFEFWIDRRFYLKNSCREAGLPVRSVSE